MEGVILFIVGIIVFVIGLAVSIALHEVGHLVPAKLFNVRVPQYMIGFGPTLLSKRIGETEYGLKALPLGGYVSMIGMFPPKHRGEAPREGGTGFVSSLIEDARSASVEQIGHDEHHRAFYRLATWKRLIVMLGGPAMNIVLALIAFLIVCSGFGIFQSTTTVESIYSCVVSQAEQQEQQDAGEEPTCDTVSPAAEAGLEPGDRVLAVDGEPIGDWNRLSEIIRENPGVPLDFTIVRGGAETELTVTPTPNTMYVLDPFSGQRLENPDGSYQTQEVGYVGFTPTSERQQQPPTYAVELTGYNIERVVQVVLTMPQRVVDMWNAGFGGAERDPEGPMSVVGVGRVTGEITAQTSIPVLDRVASIVMLIGSLNIALAVMNLVPLPPLDGGHVAAALVDGIRRGVARLLRRPDPGYFDTAKLVPVTMVVSGVLIVLMALFVYVDIVNPIVLFE
ncbi:peptidase [Pseudoclavibacter endophyticus]|uniref:Site-2 protease family protein n=1 Tax=Pseudoclavibacter endophyticus TaxID=1778590 RepID=A0A6H9WQB5_9MICO|nr:site-2 protease family protein [Pseudoclavibacter endophyticus]KAB1649901.1 site-2 protease family protein [Pseudoclavibacter endophyticus]GGA58852.1 peptidase [Pseudoclavibacter endophyticus]